MYTTTAHEKKRVRDEGIKLIVFVHRLVRLDVDFAANKPRNIIELNGKLIEANSR